MPRLYLSLFGHRFGVVCFCWYGSWCQAVDLEAGAYVVILGNYFGIWSSSPKGLLGRRFASISLLKLLKFVLMQNFRTRFWEIFNAVCACRASVGQVTKIADLDIVPQSYWHVVGREIISNIAVNCRVVVFLPAYNCPKIAAKFLEGLNIGTSEANS